MNPSELKEIMRKVSIFGDLSEKELNEISSHESNLLTFKHGQFIIRQGEIDFALFVLLEGKATVTRDDAPGAVISTLASGDAFGELSFLGKRLRSTNVIALGESRVLKIDGMVLDSLAPELQNKLKDQFIKVFIKRTDSMNSTVLKLKEELKEIYQMVNEPMDWLDKKNSNRHKQVVQGLENIMSKVDSLLLRI